MELAAEMVTVERQDESSSTLLAEREAPSFEQYLEKSGKVDLRDILTPRRQYVSVTLEVGVGEMPFTGGLGILEGDKLLQAEESGVPYTALTLAYSERWNQRLEDYYQKEDFETVTPEDLGLERIGKTSIKIIGWQGEEVVKEIDICRKSFGSAQILALYMPDLREVYYANNSSEHRLLQQVILGFAGQDAMDYVGIEPSMLQVNESAPVFSAVAHLDRLVQSGTSFEEAMRQTRQTTLFTNHTLVQAAVSSFSRELFERLVIPNIKSDEVKSWFYGMIESQGDHQSQIAFELSGKQNGVSKLHAEIASARFRRIDGSPVAFEANTNGIFMRRWSHPRFFEMYKKQGIIDEFNRPADVGAIADLDYEERFEIKKEAKGEMIDYLKTRIDQDGNPVNIPSDAKVAAWARRLTGYKQPFMFLEDPEELARVLEEEDMHLVMAGKVHPTDESMKVDLKDALLKIRDNPVLRERVHFVQDYDVDLAKHLVAGADIWLNTPRRGEEACGTSPFKAIINDTIVVSVEDGGLADAQPAPYIAITGEDIYGKLRMASRELSIPAARMTRVKEQLEAYIGTIPSGAMQDKNIEFGFRSRLPLAA